MTGELLSPFARRQTVKRSSRLLLLPTLKCFLERSGVGNFLRHGIQKCGAASSREPRTGLILVCHSCMHELPNPEQLLLIVSASFDAPKDSGCACVDQLRARASDCVTCLTPAPKSSVLTFFGVCLWSPQILGAIRQLLLEALPRPGLTGCQEVNPALNLVSLVVSGSQHARAGFGWWCPGAVRPPAPREEDDRFITRLLTMASTHHPLAPGARACLPNTPARASLARHLSHYPLTHPLFPRNST